MSHSDQQRLDALRPLRRRPPLGTRRATLVALGVVCFVGLGVLVDFLTYSITGRMFDKDVSLHSYLDHRITLSALDRLLAPPSLPKRNYHAAPLDHVEKARFAQEMSLALPAPSEGWTRKPFAAEDFWSLRRDLAACRKYDDDLLRAKALIGDSRGCPPGLGGAGFEVYTRTGQDVEEQIALMIRYIAPDPQIPASQDIANAPLPAFGAVNFSGSAQARRMTPYFRSADWSFGALAQLVVRGNAKSTDLPQRVFAQNAGDGLIQIFAVSTASAGATQALLRQIDYGFLTAMLAQPFDS